MDPLQKNEEESTLTFEVSEVLRASSKEEIPKDKVLESNEGSSSTVSSLDFIMSSPSDRSEGSLFISTTRTSISTKEIDEKASKGNHSIRDNCKDENNIPIRLEISSHLQSFLTKSDDPVDDPNSNISIRTYSLENPFESKSILKSTPVSVTDTRTQCSYSLATVKITETSTDSMLCSDSVLRDNYKDILGNDKDDKKFVLHNSEKTSNQSNIHKSVLLNDFKKQSSENEMLMVKESSATSSCPLGKIEVSKTLSSMSKSVKELYSKQIGDSEDFIEPTPPTSSKILQQRKSKENFKRTEMVRERLPSKPVLKSIIQDQRKARRSEGNIKQWLFTSEGYIPSQTIIAKNIDFMNGPKFKSQGDIKTPVLPPSSLKDSKPIKNTKCTSQDSSTSKRNILSSASYLFRVKMCPSGDLPGLILESKPQKTSSPLATTARNETHLKKEEAGLSSSPSEQKKTSEKTVSEPAPLKSGTTQRAATVPKSKTQPTVKKKRIQKTRSNSCNKFYEDGLLSRPSDIFMFYDPPYLCSTNVKGRFDTDSSSKSEDSMSFEYSEDSSPCTESSIKSEATKIIDLCKDPQNMYGESNFGAYRVKMERQYENQAKCIQVIYGDIDKTVEGFISKEKMGSKEITYAKSKEEEEEEGKGKEEEDEGDKGKGDEKEQNDKTGRKTKYITDTKITQMKNEEYSESIKTSGSVSIRQENFHSVSVGTRTESDGSTYSYTESFHTRQEDEKITEEMNQTNESIKRNSDENSEVSTPRSTPSQMGCVVNVVIRKKSDHASSTLVVRKKEGKKKKSHGNQKKLKAKDSSHKATNRGSSSGKKRVKIVGRKEASRDFGIENASSLLKKITMDLQNQLMLAQYLQDVHLCKRGILKKPQEPTTVKRSNMEEQTNTLNDIMWTSSFDEANNSEQAVQLRHDPVSDAHGGVEHKTKRTQQSGVRSLYSSLGKMLLAKLSGRQLNTTSLSKEPSVYAVAATEVSSKRSTIVRSSSTSKVYPAPPPSPSFSYSDMDQTQALKHTPSRSEEKYSVHQSRPSHPPARRKRSKASKSRYTIHDSTEKSLRPSSAPYSSSTTVVQKSRSQSQPATRTSSVATIRHDEKGDYKADKKWTPRSVSEPRRQVEAQDARRQVPSKDSLPSVRSVEVATARDKAPEDHVTKRDAQTEPQAARVRQASTRGTKKLSWRGSAVHSRRSKGSARPKSSRKKATAKKPVTHSESKEDTSSRREASPPKQNPRAGDRKTERLSRATARRTTGSVGPQGATKVSPDIKAQGNGLQAGKSQVRESSPTRENRGKSTAKQSFDASKKPNAWPDATKNPRGGTNKQGNTSGTRESRMKGGGKGSRILDGESSRTTKGGRASQKSDGGRGSRGTGGGRVARKAEGGRGPRRTGGGSKTSDRDSRKTGVCDSQKLDEWKDNRRTEGGESRRIDAEYECRRCEGGGECRRIEGERERRSEGGRDGKKSDRGRDGRRSDRGRDGRRSDGGRDGKRSDGGRDGKRSDGGRDGKRSDGGRDGKRSDGGREGRKPDGGRDRRRSNGRKDRRKSKGRRGSKTSDRRGSRTSDRRDSRKSEGGGSRRNSKRSSQASQGSQGSQGSQESDPCAKGREQLRVVDNITRPSIRTIYVQGACSRVAFKAGGLLYPVNLLGHANPCAPICCNPCLMNCDTWETQPQHIFAKRPPIDFFRSDTIDFPNDKPIVAVPRSRLMPKSKVLLAAQQIKRPQRSKAPPPQETEEEEDRPDSDEESDFPPSEPTTAASEQPLTESETEEEEEEGDELDEEEEDDEKSGPTTVEDISDEED